MRRRHSAIEDPEATHRRSAKLDTRPRLPEATHRHSAKTRPRLTEATHRRSAKLLEDPEATHA
jgi:hypothetical protein